MEKPISISYIIPCYNSEETLNKCVQSILNQKEIINKEIIIVDSSESENTKLLVTKFNSGDIKYIYSKDRLYPGQARNLGLTKAKGDYLVCLDSDIIINRYWTINMLLKHKELSENYINIILMGSIKNSQITDSYLSNFLIFFMCYKFLESKKLSFRPWLPGTNIFFSKESYESLNISFPDGRLSEDVIMSRNFKGAGGKLFFYGSNVVEHITQRTPFLYIAQLGIASSISWREGKWRRCFFTLILPFGFLYKLIGIFSGTVYYNPNHLVQIFKYFPALLTGSLIYQIGMIRGFLGLYKDENSV